MKKESSGFLFYGVLVLAVVSVLGSLFVFQLTQGVQNEIEGGHSDAAGIVSITVVDPNEGKYGGSSETTGRVTLTVVEPE